LHQNNESINVYCLIQGKSVHVVQNNKEQNTSIQKIINVHVWAYSH